MAMSVLKEKGKKYVGLPEFARVGGQIVAELQLEQERGTVTSVPDERTIRYYLAEGLIQTPEERQGTASVRDRSRRPKHRPPAVRPTGGYLRRLVSSHPANSAPNTRSPDAVITAWNGSRPASQ